MREAGEKERENGKNVVSGDVSWLGELWSIKFTVEFPHLRQGRGASDPHLVTG